MYHLTNDVRVIESSVCEIVSRGTNDAKVSLCVGWDVAGERWAFLKTNGGPRLIQEEDSRDACSVDAAAATLDMSRADLVALLRTEIPGLDW